MYDLSSIWLVEFIWRNRDLISWVLVILMLWLCCGMISTNLLKNSSSDDD